MTVGDLNTFCPLRYDIDVLVPLAGVTLEDFLSVPRKSNGIVLFAHGSSSDCHSLCNHFVAKQLSKRQFSTLLTDLLMPSEIRTENEARYLHFDIDLLSDRLSQIIKWIEPHHKIGGFPVSLFDVDAGAAVALDALI